jgi:hypothetical protein
MPEKDLASLILDTRERALVEIERRGPAILAAFIYAAFAAAVMSALMTESDRGLA